MTHGLTCDCPAVGLGCWQRGSAGLQLLNAHGRHPNHRHRHGNSP